MILLVLGRSKKLKADKGNDHSFSGLWHTCIVVKAADVVSAVSHVGRESFQPGLFRPILVCPVSLIFLTIG